MSKHTKGPWQKTHLRDGTKSVPVWRIGTGKYGPIARVGGHGEEDPETVEANACLIASAPVLEETLRWITETAIQGIGRNADAYLDTIATRAASALAAIAQATKK